MSRGSWTDTLRKTFPASEDKGKATTSWLDLDAQNPDHAVGFLDMLKAVEGIKDVPYQHDDPCTCAGFHVIEASKR